MRGHAKDLKKIVKEVRRHYKERGDADTWIERTRNERFIKYKVGGEIVSFTFPISPSRASSVTNARSIIRREFKRVA